MSRILIWSPAYAPELLGIPPLVTQAAEWLAGRGHAVDVVTPMPNNPDRVIYPDYRGRVWLTERRGDVNVRRAWVRVRPGESFLDKVLWEASFTAAALPFALRRVRTSDVVVAVVPPLGGAAASALLVRISRRLRRRVRLVLWVQDLVLRAAPAVRSLGPHHRALVAAAARIEGAAARAADRVVVCSPAFVEHFERLGVERERLAVVFNWVDLGRIRPLPAATSGPTRFLYAGNLGYTQGFETLVEAARIVGESVEVDIVGGGNAANAVRELASGTTNVRVRGPVRPEEFPALLGSAQVQLVLQRGMASNANFPSKIAAYMASGRPIIASLEPGSAAAATLVESGAAVVVPPERPDALAEAMIALRNDAPRRAELGERARAFACERFGKEETLESLERQFMGTGA